jgi:two-component system OmpR family sensor kinase
MKGWRFLIIAPVLIGLVISIVLNAGFIQNPTIFFRADLGTWVLLIGISASVIVFSVFLIQERYNSVREATRLGYTEEKRRFLQRLDHELKNPITAIRVGLANLGDPNSPNHDETITSINSQAIRLSRLIKDLRKLSDLEASQLELRRVDMNGLLTEVYNTTLESALAQDRFLTMNTPRVPWPLPTMDGDHDLLALAIHNLLDNALKFTNPGDSIEVRAFENSNWINIEVADTGPGIPDEELPHVWEELYRGKSARSIPGSGLGLALVRAVVDLHNGRCTIRSREGQGTIVEIGIPT